MKTIPLAEAPPKDKTVLWIGISAVVAVAMLAGVVMLGLRVSAMEGRFTEAKGQYEKMKDMRKVILDLQRKGGAKPKIDERPEGLTGYLSKAANNVGLSSSSITFNPGLPMKSGGWEETPITAEINATKDAPILHTALAAYLSAVEKDSFLKTKNLILTYAGSDFQHASITFSFYRRQ